MEVDGEKMMTSGFQKRVIFEVQNVNFQGGVNQHIVMFTRNFMDFKSKGLFSIASHINLRQLRFLTQRIMYMV